MHRGLSLGASIHHQQQQNRGGSNNVYDGKIAGLYDLEETLGRGHFAVVKLARHVFTGEKVAVKVIDKSKLDEVSRSHLFQEVRCMKLVQHPNVVRLYEVIDTQTKLYLILELGDGGDLYDYIMRHETGLTEQVARDYFRQIVRAISYCHRLHVVHRDLKPENVVFFEKLGMVKLTDFGFSNKFDPGQKLETSCGSLAYSAPEILLGDSYDAPAVDVWSLGVILYMLVCGQAPFQEANDSETLTMIMDCKYTIPQHVSTPCKNLIRRMLIREPERRATLQQIANDPWLVDGKDEANIEYLPLVSRHQVSDEDHNLIIQKMVNGNIATKEEILEALDKNEYNHITATYFLLAERKLRAQRQEQMQRKQRPEQLSIITTMCGNTLGTNVTGVGNKIVGPGRPGSGTTGSGDNKLNNVNRLSVGTNNDLLQVGNNNLPNPTLLSVPRTPGDLPQRARKCSIVQEEEDEEDLSGCSGREDMASGHHHHVCSLNRRGSRSEGKLNIAIQERIAAETAEQRRRQEALKTTTVISSSPPISSTSPRPIPREALRKKTPPPPAITRITTPSSVTAAVNSVVQNQSTKWRMGGPKMFANSKSMSVDITTTSSKVSTTILNESSTISIPIQRQHLTTTPSKYKTMPSPSNLSSTQNQLNEIFEEGTNGAGGDGDASAESKSPRTFSSRTQARTNNYEQRRSKFHKTRTASCSSSDASEDDDSESRKKRAHKINTATTGKPLPGGRRDSHDDSSDSQDQGSAPAASRTAQDASSRTNTTTTTTTNTTSSSNQTNDKSSTKNTKNQSNNFNNRRQHRNGRRRTGETRLRESQSLNRITEVQEDVTTTASSAVTTTTVVHLVNSDLVLDTTDSTTEGLSQDMLESNGIIPTNNKIVKSSFGARLLQGWSLGGTTKNKEKLNLSPIKKSSRVVGDEFKLKMVTEKTNIKKMRLLGRYFQVHKKLCIPGIFGGRGRIYKAQSCSSLARDRITTTTQTVVTAGGHGDGKRPMSDLVGRTKVLLSGNNSLSDDCSINGSCGSDINQNGGLLYDTNNTKGDADDGATKPLSDTNTNGAGRICQIHLGDSTKCCNLC